MPGSSFSLQMNTRTKTIQILMAEDGPSQVTIAKEAFLDAKMLNTLHVVPDGIEALEFLLQKGKYPQAPRPDLILLDLNLPRKGGLEVLAEIKSHNDLKHIPVVILTSSKAEEDIAEAYRHHANCFITKPSDFEDFTKVLRSIQKFWLTVVCLPNAS